LKDKADEYIVSAPLVNPTDADFTGMTPVKLSIVVDEQKDKAYEGNVRVLPVGAENIQLWAKDTSGNWYDINQVGWGPQGGFPIDTTLVTDVYVIATAAFDGTVTLELVDVTGDYGAVDNIIISQEVLVKAVDPIADLVEGTSMTVVVDGNVVTATIEYPETIDELLADWKVDAKLESTQEMPEGTKVNIEYNGTLVAEGVDVSNKTSVYLSELLPGENRPSIVPHAGLVDTWVITITAEESINADVTVKSVISNDDFVSEVVIAQDEVTLEPEPVEPEEYHTYKFNIEDKADEYIVSAPLVNPTDADFTGMTPVKLSIVVDEQKDKAYEGNVRVLPVGAENIQLWAKDTSGNWYDINQVGWGPQGGFPIDTTLVTDVYVIATAAFDGTVTLELVDVTGDYGAVDNIIISQEVLVKAVDPIADLVEGTSMTVVVDGNVVTATIEYPETIDELLADWKVDAKLESTQEMPEGTKVNIEYNGTLVAEGVDVSNKTSVYLSELLPGENRPSIVPHAGLVDTWVITITAEESINADVTVKSVISNDDFVSEVVIAQDEVTLEPEPVEPEEYHTYKFNIEDKADEYIVSAPLVNPTDADFTGMTPVKLSIVVDEQKDKAYEGNVRVLPVGAENIQLWAKDTSGNWYDINQVGWGPQGGFPIDTTLVTDVYVIATAAFDGTVTLELVDVTGDYGAVDNIIISQEVLVKAVDPIADLVEGTSMTVVVDGNVVTATIEYPETIDELLADWKVDAKLESTQEMPEGTKVNIEYNGTLVAEGVDVSNKTSVYLSELLPGENRPSIVPHAGLVDTWVITITAEESINADVTVKSVISNDDFVSEVVIAQDEVTLEPEPVEPEEYHTYKFNIEDKADEYIVSAPLVNPTDADFTGMTPVKLSIVVDEQKDKAYEGNVRVLPVGAENIQLWAKDTSGNWYDINQVGWGPQGGFPIDTTLVTDVYVIATAAFDGTVTLELVDVTGDYGAVDNIIISQEVLVKARCAGRYKRLRRYRRPSSYLR
jgi:hypothetical protein